MSDLSFMRKIRVSLAAAAMVLGVGLGSAASAIPVDVLNSPDIGDVVIAPPPPGAGTAYITCALGCLGWTGATFGAGAFNSGVKGDVYDMQWPPSAANELEELKYVSGDASLTDASTLDTGGASVFDLVVQAGTYLKLKFGNFGTPGAGNASAFFYSPVAQTITYNQNGQRGGGLSHATVIPLPAAAWLMLAGLGGLGLVSRRRKASDA